MSEGPTCLEQALLSQYPPIFLADLPWWGGYCHPIGDKRDMRGPQCLRWGSISCLPPCLTPQASAQLCKWSRVGLRELHWPGVGGGGQNEACLALQDERGHVPHLGHTFSSGPRDTCQPRQRPLCAWQVYGPSLPTPAHIPGLAQQGSVDRAVSYTLGRAGEAAWAQAYVQVAG